MTDPTIRFRQEAENLKRLSSGSAEAQLVRLLADPRVGALRRQIYEGESLRHAMRDAFTTRYGTMAEDVALRSAAEAIQLRSQFLTDSVSRAVKTFKGYSPSRLLRSLDPGRFADPLSRLDRAANDLARSIRWNELDELRSAAAADVWADAFNDALPTALSDDGDLVLDDEMAIGVEAAAEVITDTARIVQQTAPEAATRQDLQEANDVILMRLDEYARQKPTPVKIFMNTWVIPTLIGTSVSVGIAILQSRGAFDPAPPARVEMAAEKPRLYRVKGHHLSLRAEPSTESDIRVKLDRGETVVAVERRDDGWLFVKARN